jgi:hypothetical protein
MCTVCTSHPISTPELHLTTRHPVNLDHTAVGDLLASAMAAMASVADVIVGVHQILPHDFTVVAADKKAAGSTAGSSIGFALSS